MRERSQEEEPTFMARDTFGLSVSDEDDIVPEEEIETEGEEGGGVFAPQGPDTGDEEEGASEAF